MRTKEWIVCVPQNTDQPSWFVGLTKEDRAWFDEAQKGLTADEIRKAVSSDLDVLYGLTFC